MDERSWWQVEPDPPELGLPRDLRARDPLQGRDCGWVSQMRPFVRHFCPPGGVVLDPFCGFGTTLLAAHLEGRTACGIEIDAGRAAIARARLRRHGCDAPVRVGSLPATAPGRPVQLCLTNVPYFGCGWRGAERPGQLYAVASYADYLDGLREVFHGVRAALAEGGYCITMVENVVVGGRALPQAHDLATLLAGLFVPCEERLLVYPRPARPLAAGDGASNRSHEYALVFRRRREAMDLDAADALLAALRRERFDVVPYGSHARWTRARDAACEPPADLDLLLPRDQAELDRLLAWLAGQGFGFRAWARPVAAGVSLQALERLHYLRAERIDAAGGRLQLDLALRPEG